MINMKNIKNYDDFLLERYLELDIEPPKRDEKYNFLVEVTKKCGYETTYHFFVKDLIEIGTADNHKLYLNYLDFNEYDNRLSYWVIYNEKPDHLYGTSWDSGVIWEEDGVLQHTEKHNFVLYPDFIDRIYEKIKSYSDLDEWCKYIKDIGIKGRKYHRWAIQNSYKDKKDRTELTWEENLDWTKNRIEVDKLLNRYKKPYDEKQLEEMLKLGEEKWNDKMEKQNKMMMDIMKKTDWYKNNNKDND